MRKVQAIAILLFLIVLSPVRVEAKKEGKDSKKEKPAKVVADKKEEISVKKGRNDSTSVNTDTNAHATVTPPLSPATATSKKADSTSSSAPKNPDLGGGNYMKYWIGFSVFGILVGVIIFLSLKLCKISKVGVDANTNEDATSTQGNEFYMAIPEGHGFIDKKKSSVPVKGVSFFKFTISQANKKKATYEAVPGPDTLKLIRDNFYADDIKNTCFFVNELSKNTIGFTIDKKGEAQLQNGKWFVNTRTRLLFTNKPNDKGGNKGVENIILPQSKHSYQTANINIEEAELNLTGAPPQEPIAPAPVAKDIPKQFFMGMPDGNMFPGYAKSPSYKPGISMFDFFEQGGNRAKFRMISDAETVKFIKNTFIDNIKPACIVMNLPSTDTTRIETKELGTAIFDGENWKIDEQATIIFH